MTETAQETVRLILEDMSGAAADLVKAVNGKLGPNPALEVWRGQECARTDLEPIAVLRELYPEIPDDDDPQVQQLRVAFLSFLRRTGAYVLINGRTPEENYWLVRYQPVDAAPDKQPEQPERPEEQVEPVAPEPVAPEPAAPEPAAPEQPQPERTCPTCGKPVPNSGRGRPAIYCSRKCRPSNSGGGPSAEALPKYEDPHGGRKCPLCPYVGKTRASLHVHVTRLKGRPHPQDAFPCLDKPYSGCDVVVNSRAHLRRHLIEDHRYVGEMCAGCTRWFKDLADMEAHVMEAHPDKTRRSTVAAPSVPAEAPAGDQSAPTVGAGITPEMIQAEVLRIVREYGVLVERVPRLEEALRQERARREKAEAELTTIRRRLRALVGEE